MTGATEPERPGGRTFRGSSSRRTHGLVVAGLLAVVGVIALFSAGPGLPDGELIGALNLVLAGGVAVYVARTAWRPGIDLVLDDDGIWFRGWDLPTVPWRHVAEARMAGSRIRPLLYVELDDPEALFAAIDAAAGKRRAANSLVRETRLLIPNSALDAPLGEVVEAIREAHANVATVA